MDPENTHPHRRNIRLPDYDYSQPGAWFVTVVTHNRKPYFGQIVDGEMVLNEVGIVVKSVFEEIPKHFPNVALGEFVIMPNHLHAIISITGEAKQTNNVVSQQEPRCPKVAATHASPLRKKPDGPIPGSLGAIIGSFKSAATKRVHQLIDQEGTVLWQLNYYEHIIRAEKDYQAIYDYILANPMNWQKDAENIDG